MCIRSALDPIGRVCDDDRGWRRNSITPPVFDAGKDSRFQPLLRRLAAGSWDMAVLNCRLSGKCNNDKLAFDLPGWKKNEGWAKNADFIRGIAVFIGEHWAAGD
jgi:hypothetical protein